MPPEPMTLVVGVVLVLRQDIRAIGTGALRLWLSEFRVSLKVSL